MQVSQNILSPELLLLYKFISENKFIKYQSLLPQNNLQEILKLPLSHRRHKQLKNVARTQRTSSKVYSFFLQKGWAGSWWAVSLLIRVVSWLISPRTLNVRLHWATGINKSPHGTTKYHLFFRIKLNLFSDQLGKDLLS